MTLAPAPHGYTCVMAQTVTEADMTATPRWEAHARVWLEKGVRS